jgi:KDO2-lipid IV(A) lauroyltransferase
VVDELYPPPPWRWAQRAALWRYWVRDPVDAVKDIVPHHLMRLLPSQLVSDIGARLGRRAGVRAKVASRRARETLRLLRPEASEAEIEALLAAHWAHVGRCFAEFSVLERLWPEGCIAVEGAEHVATAREAGRPLIFAGLHVGNWEAMHAGISGMGVPLAGIYQRLDNRFRMGVANQARRRTPIRLLDPVPASAIVARRALDRREQVVLMYVDEDVGRRVHAPLLGRAPRPEGNIHRLARLAGLTGAAVLPVHALRLGAAPRFRLVIGPELPLLRRPRDPEALAEDQARLDAAAEAVVRPNPEQWLMLNAFRPDL